jgi:hypothetical protein
VQLRAGGDLLALQQLLHKINAPARTIQLIAQQPVRGAAAQAKAAVHAAAQDRVRFLPRGGVADEIGERGLHG